MGAATTSAPWINLRARAGLCQEGGRSSALSIGTRRSLVRWISTAKLDLRPLSWLLLPREGQRSRERVSKPVTRSLLLFRLWHRGRGNLECWRQSTRGPWQEEGGWACLQDWMKMKLTRKGRRVRVKIRQTVPLAAFTSIEIRQPLLWWTQMVKDRRERQRKWEEVSRLRQRKLALFPSTQEPLPPPPPPPSLQAQASHLRVRLTP